MSRGRRSDPFRAAASTYATNAGAAALSLANVLIIARALGVSGRGQVAFLIAVVTVATWVASFSIQEANANIAGSDPHTRASLATNSILFALGFGAAAFLVIAGAVEVVPGAGGHVARPLFYLSLAALPLAILKQYLQYLIQADYGFKVTNIAWIMSPITTVLINGTLSVLGVISVGTAMGAWVLGQGLGTGLLIGRVVQGAGFGRPDLSLARRSLAFACRTHIGQFMHVGNYRIDQWILGSVKGSTALGEYSIAVAWAEMLFYIPGILVLVQRPDLVRATREEASWRATRVVRGAMLINVVAVLGLLVFAPVLCVTVFGSGFHASVPELRVLALGAFGIALMELLRNALTAQRRPMLASGAVSVAFVLTMALDLTLIPAMGGMGAALATTIAYTGGGIAVAIIVTRVFDARLTDMIPRIGDARWLVRKARAALRGSPRLREAAG